MSPSEVKTSPPRVKTYPSLIIWILILFIFLSLLFHYDLTTFVFYWRRCRSYMATEFLERFSEEKQEEEDDVWCLMYDDDVTINVSYVWENIYFHFIIFTIICSSMTFISVTIFYYDVLCLMYDDDALNHVWEKNIIFVLVHCNSIITRSSGSTGKTALYTCDRYSKSLTVNATSFTCIHIRKQMPHPPSFRMGHQSAYLVYSYNTQTFHKSWYQ